jgi:hypothetical protein
VPTLNVYRIGEVLAAFMLAAVNISRVIGLTPVELRTLFDSVCSKEEQRDAPS